MTDRSWLYFAVFMRSIATGMIGVLLGIYLAQLFISAGSIAVLVGLGLAGAAVATLIVTVYADRIGHRKLLIAIALLSCLGAVLLATSTNVLVLGFAVFIGMVNGMGRDRGAALVIEQAALPATVTDRDRTMVFARYNVLQDIGHAVGSLLAILPTLLQQLNIAAGPEAFRGSMIVYGALSFLPILAYLRLTSKIEAPVSSTTQRLSPESRSVVWRISSLFALDSIGGGFLTTALLAYFFYERFGVGVETVGLLFFCARVANAGSHLAAAWLARRIGLVKTMVFTHIPSSLLLVTVAFVPSFPIAAALFLLRESLVEMDVPTRQSYVMAVVKPHERTFASGITHLVRLGGWAIAPMFAGLLIKESSLIVPLIVGAGMKIFYDLMLWRSFRGLRPPEESRLEKG
jgi:MFS family permease